ncbi:MAG: hypothetical protein EA425_13645 [Puniceicoccaceae bacterium]|nr:MAG: hypothetical protein EA425_13645 [Puniceicoccaceae bacterium]
MDIPIAAYFIAGLGLVTLLGSWLNQRVGSPVLAILNRWLRWITFSVATAYLVRYLEWTDRPFWALALITFLIWLLVESLYTWFAINALSQSTVALFPRFKANTSGEEWPARPGYIALRDYLRREQFRQVQALLAELAEGINLRVSVYQDPENLVRLQVLFLPQGGGGLTACFQLSSKTESDRRLMTDNLFLPFGGFYPENWLVVRKPWTRRLSSLLNHHRRRLQECGEALKAWENDPLDDLNAQQSELERVNTELGFLLPHHMREEHGRMTWEGRYRVWKEVWLLNYFGLTAHHRG